MAFDTLDLGRVLQTAEAIKGLRRQESDDKLRNAYMDTQIAGAKQAQGIQAQTAAAEQQSLVAKRQYYTAQAALNSADPKGTIEAIAPQFVQDFETKHGQGSWQQLTPEMAHTAAQTILQQAETVIGPQQKVKWIDSGGQQIPVDEVTGQPIRGATPLVKTASPDALLSSQTSTANSSASNATSRANNEATVAATLRGQDITAETARVTQGGKITETQGNAKAFGLRATEANKALEAMIAPKDKGGGGYKPTGISAAWDAMNAGHLGTNWMASDDGQTYQNAAKALIAPILRKESGAAISESEWTAAKQLYIPWPGDSAAVLKQKKSNRDNAIQGIAVQAGPGGIPAAEHPSSGGWSIKPVQ